MIKYFCDYCKQEKDKDEVAEYNFRISVGWNDTKMLVIEQCCLGCKEGISKGLLPLISKLENDQKLSERVDLYDT